MKLAEIAVGEQYVMDGPSISSGAGLSQYTVVRVIAVDPRGARTRRVKVKVIDAPFHAKLRRGQTDSVLPSRLLYRRGDVIAARA